MSWKKTVALAKLVDKPQVVRIGSRQLALFRVEGDYYAIDNRCPHEGYPLAEGSVDDSCVLTCNWHNWKFRLQDGRCVLGGDHVRSYAVRPDNDGYLWVDLADPPREIVECQVLEGLRTAFDQRDYGRICREITRLHVNGIDPVLAVQRAIQWSYDRFEFGTTHAFAATADWLTLAARYQNDWEIQLICLAESIDHMAFDALRHPIYPYGNANGNHANGATANALLDAIESQQTEAAESIVKSMLAQGGEWQQVEAVLTESALAHYNDFGHSLIYVLKTAELVKRLGPDRTGELAVCLTRSISFATREDLIPEFSTYTSTLRRCAPAADPHDPNRNGVGRVGNGPDERLEIPYPVSLSAALAWVADYFTEYGASPVYDALLTVLARNLLQFDAAYGSANDVPVSKSVGWLNVTHGITFANAVRRLCLKYPHLWLRGLLQMACMAGRNRQFLDPAGDQSEWFVKDRETFFAAAHETILDHGMRDPIFSAHLLKTTLAVEDELPHTSAACQEYLLAGLNRFLHSPIKQKHTRRLARQAIELVQRDYR